jgi:flagellar hook protein FlgE
VTFEQYMPLGSVLQTSLSGISAATAMLDAAALNIANMHTNGYKAVRPTFVAQTPTTYSQGSEPTNDSGGSSLVQIGNGVAHTGFETDESPGTLVATDDGVVELSNVDLGEELVNTILASNSFRANANSFDAADSLLDELVHLPRR